MGQAGDVTARSHWAWNACAAVRDDGGCDGARLRGPSSSCQAGGHHIVALSSYFLKKRYIDFYVKSYCFPTLVFPKHGSKNCVRQTKPAGTRFARGLQCVPSGLQASGPWLLCTLDKQNVAFSCSTFWGHLVTRGLEALYDKTRWFR